MSDNQDLKSKILLMRQKNFGEIINETNEKNDNEKPVNTELNHDESNTESNQNTDELDQNSDEVNQNKTQENRGWRVSHFLSYRSLQLPLLFEHQQV